MSNLKHTILMLCVFLLGASCFAHDVDVMEKKGDGIPILVKENTIHNGSDRSGAIVANINGHYLTVSFTENLGQVTIEVSTVSGTSVHFTTTPTPNGVQCYIPNAGDYVVTFTLPNGDEYYGEFTVTE